MNKLLTAIALSIALPAIAHAADTPPPAAEKDCCEKMKAEGKDCCCCKDMDKMNHAEHGDHAKADEHHAHQH